LTDNNIFLGQDGQVGVIDFGDVAYADVSRDFIDFPDDEMLFAALESYGADDLLTQKVAFRRKIVPIMGLVFYEVKGEFDNIEKNIAKIRETIIGTSA
jgi:hypothetical protein